MQRSSTTSAHLFPPHLTYVAANLRIVDDPREFERLPAVRNSTFRIEQTDRISDAKYV